MMTAEGKRQWRKILYEDQGYPDNYTDKSFLHEMKKNCMCNLSFVDLSIPL